MPHKNSAMNKDHALPILKNRFLNKLKIPPPLHPKSDQWPWTDPNQGGSRPISLRPSLPLLSIVIPCYNSGSYIEEAIRSILLQDYPFIQIIIVDGGSSDSTLLVVDYYRQWIDKVISEPDNGQADAINKGLSHCSGDYFNWINSDDLLAPGSLSMLFDNLDQHPDIIASSVGNFHDEDLANFEIIPNLKLSARNFLIGLSSGISYHQPGVWLSMNLLHDKPMLDDEMHYVFDSEMMIRLLAKPRKVLYKDFISIYFRLHEGSKTVSKSDLLHKENHYMPIRIFDNPTLVSLHKLQARILLIRGWNEYVRSLFVRQPSFSALASLLLHMLSDPFYRINRFSIGAARYLLMGTLYNPDSAKLRCVSKK